MSIESIKKQVATIRQQIVQHPVYHQIQTPEDLSVFMEHHVFAVWDFMSLLKTLQNLLTCTQVPWVPVGHPDNRFLINEIVVGEESDVDAFGNRMSHYELYLQAMDACTADTSVVQSFVKSCGQTKNVTASIQASTLPTTVKDFLSFTFEVIATGEPHVVAAVFTFGREDLIPDMFMSMVSQLHAQWPENIAPFKYYLERHIEIDGGHHNLLATQMVSNLCGDDTAKWDEATRYVLACLEKRKALWDGVLQSINEKAKHSTLPA